jgi:hypothetical protein
MRAQEGHPSLIHDCRHSFDVCGVCVGGEHHFQRYFRYIVAVSFIVHYRFSYATIMCLSKVHLFVVLFVLNDLR